MDHRTGKATVVGDDPRAEYRRRHDESRSKATGLARQDDALGNVRLGLFLAGIVLAILAWRGNLGPVWACLPFVGFAVVVFLHGRITTDRRKAEGRVALHERALARLDGRWSGLGVPGTRFLDEDHPYAADLDLFGVGSLFERLCTARTPTGEAVLASWLLSPASPGEIAERREAIIELRPRLDLREDLSLRGDAVRSSGPPEGLAAWGAMPQRKASRWLRLLILLTTLLTVGSLIAWLADFLGGFVCFVCLAVEAAIAALLARRTSHAVAGVEDRSAELVTLAGLLERIEDEPFDSPRLRMLKGSLGDQGLPASRQIAHLAGLVQWLEARHNVYFALFSSLLLWKTQLGLAIESWRATEGASIARWLKVVGEFEALASLAEYAFENPADPFPEILPDGPIYEGESIGHPLLAESVCVRNDLKLGGELRVLAVSGSNMSGKSTWLRTLGINAVLAQMGAPVRAKWLRLSPLTIGGTLRVHDSLQAGRSRFYAEILRLKQLVEMAGGSPPLFFLIDEVLHGTNSHDRLQGAEAVIRGLIDRGAIGLFTTHDLTLAEVAGRLAPRAMNVHFADHLDESGRLAFDYKMRPGIVTQSNALALMRAVGLEV
ncbi:MutS-related protein [Tundrisphaera lichenicola]|uniref:MutS-related protein n=1 Tax=Tundrisphaera lichenicola TaxID=2029860 RepID=UPI003EBC38D9